MDISLRKLAIYQFTKYPEFTKEDLQAMEEIIGSIEGTRAIQVIVDAEGDTAMVIAEESEGGGYIEDFIDLVIDRMRSLHNTLELLGDEEHCDIALAFADPCTEIYVCWNHRKIWEINTTYIGSQLDNPPKTCKECKILIEKAKVAEKKAEQEVKELEPDDWE